jgi:hypothetical protein
MKNNKESMDNGEAGQLVQDHLREAYGRHPDGSFGKVIGPSMGQGYLEALDYFKEERRWDYVSVGFSDLYGDAEPEDQPSEDFELTFRILRAEDEKAPGQWPFRIFEEFAGNLAATNSMFSEYDFVELDNGVLDADIPNGFVGGVFIPDDKIAPLKTKKKNITFLQFVPVAKEELALVKEQARILEETQDIDSYNGAVKELIEKIKSATNPALATDLARKSVI